VQRIRSKIAGQNPLKVQSATARKLERLIKGAAPAKLRKRPAPAKWSAAEILAHLADAEIVVSARLRSILGAPGTPLQAFDQDAWVAAGHYAKRDARKSLEPEPHVAAVETPRRSCRARRGIRRAHRANDGWPRHQPPGASRRNAQLQKSKIEFLTEQIYVSQTTPSPGTII